MSWVAFRQNGVFRVYSLPVLIMMENDFMERS